MGGLNYSLQYHQIFLAPFELLHKFKTTTSPWLFLFHHLSKWIQNFTEGMDFSKDIKKEQ
jgi:hypothetical protein